MHEHDQRGPGQRIISWWYTQPNGTVTYELPEARPPRWTRHVLATYTHRRQLVSAIYTLRDHLTWKSEKFLTNCQSTSEKLDVDQRRSIKIQLAVRSVVF